MTTADVFALCAAFIAVVVAVVALRLGLLVHRAVGANTQAAAEAPDVPYGRRPRAAVVINPSKFADPVPLREAVERVCAEQGWAPPLWLETTVEDPGAGVTREALAEGVDLVVACGGDGTLRKVAEGLAGSGTPMGLLPAGTGNLLARNLDVVIRPSREFSPFDATWAMRVALTGEDRPIDVGWIRIERPDGTVEDDQAFLVMAGMGFDAEIMAAVPAELKAKVGVMAYFVSGLQRFNGDRVRTSVLVDGSAHQLKARTVVVGNVGRLQGGLALMPDAEVDDGYLDVVVVGPRGIVGWLDVAARVITRHRRTDHRLAHWRGRDIELSGERPQQAQIDGDTVGEAKRLRLRVDEGALVVRVAPGSTRTTLVDVAGARVQHHVEAAAARISRARAGSSAA